MTVCKHFLLDFGKMDELDFKFEIWTNPAAVLCNFPYS